MEVSIRELRTQPGHYIQLAEAGAHVVITSHGVKRALLVPIPPPEATPNGRLKQGAEKAPGFLFGMWADRGDMEDVTSYLGSLRKGRSF